MNSPAGSAPVLTEPAAVTARLAQVQGSVRSVVFVDTTVNDYQTLIKDVAPDAKVVLLDPSREALGQMAEALSGLSGLDAIHVVSHGNDGHLYISGRAYWADGLANRGQDLQAIGAALKPGGDILFYACNVGAGDVGQDFVQTIHRLTGADVAVSGDQTGSATGQNWTLEVQSGAIEAAVPFARSSMDAFAGRLGTVVITSATGTLSGSLNHAIMNASAGDVIEFSPTLMPTKVSLGVTTTTLTAAAQNFTINGDVNGDGIADITISGDDGDGATLAAANYRGLTFNASGKTLTVKNLIMERFYHSIALQGVLTVQSGALEVDGVIFQNNLNNVITTTTATTSVTIRNSVFRDNVGEVTGTAGFAVVRTQVTGTLTIENSLLADNSYVANMGAPSANYPGATIVQQHNTAAFTVNIRNVTIANNSYINNNSAAAGVKTAGIGVYYGGSTSTATLNVYNTIIAGNSGNLGGTNFADPNAIIYDSAKVTLNADKNYQGSITGAATFVDSTNANLSLRDYRPASTATTFINKGNSSNANYYGGSYDIRGIDRIRDGVLDLGAYEVHWNAGAPTVDLNGAGTGSDESVSSGTPSSGVLIAPNATLAQTDTDTRLLGATVTLSGVVDTGNETLTLSAADVNTAKQLGIAALANDGATITLSGAASVANYQAVIRLTQYKNSANGFTGGTRTATVVVNDGETTSTARTSAITLTSGVDTTPPTVSSIAVSGTPAANASSVSFTVTFSESVTGVDTSDFTLATTGTAAGTIASVSGSGSSYTVTVNSVSGAGTLGLNLKSSGTGIQDTAATPNAIANQGFTGSTHTVDRVGPVFTSSATPSVAENTTAVVTLAATDSNGPVTYSLVGGSDQAKFSLSGAALAFAVAPNYEVPTDTDTNNVYTVIVRATDANGNTTDQTVSVTVTNVNEAPTSSTLPAVSGTPTVGQTLTTTDGTWSDPENDTLTYTYQWYRATDTAGAGETAITGATSAAYTLAAGDLGKYVRVVVTANDGNGGTPTAASGYSLVGAATSSGEGYNIFFIANDGTNGAELWAYNSVTGKSAMLGEYIRSGSASFFQSSSPGFFAYQHNGNVYLSGSDGLTVPFGGVGTELYRYDGASFTLAQDIRSGATANGYTAANSAVVVRGVIGGKLLMSTTTTDSNGYPDLFLFDGTTVTPIDLNGTANAAAVNGALYKVINDTLYFTAYLTGDTSVTLYKMDANGVVTSTGVTGVSQATWATDGTTIYYLTDQLSTGTASIRYYNTSTTASGTVLANEQTDGVALVGDLYYYQGRLYFSARMTPSSSAINGDDTELIVYDLGTSTRTAKNLWAGGASDPRGFIGVNGVVYFTASNGTDRDIFKYDPVTDTATKIVANATTLGWTTYDKSSIPVVYDGKIYFAGTTTANGNELFVLDPATDTISLVREIRSGSTGASVSGLVVFDNFDLAPLLRNLTAVKFTVGGSAVNAAANLTVVDIDSTNLTGATVTITGFTAGDILSVTNSGGITSSYNAATGVLTLTGTATDAAYQAVLRTLTFSASAAGNGARTLSLTATDGTKTSAATTWSLDGSAPVITNLSTDTVNYTPGSTTAVIIDQGTAVAVTEAGSWDGGTLRVSITSGGTSTEDVLAINNQTAGVQKISISGSNLSYSGLVIGTFTGGSNGSDLVITFNSYATTEAITALLANITYRNSNSTTYSTTSRTVSFTLTDGVGNVSTAATPTVSFSGASNGAPTNSVVPSVTGTATVGNALSATNGSWTDPDGDSLSYTYQWYRADDTNGTNAASITGATSATYTLTTSDAHKYLRVVVTANDGNSHTPTATSTYTAIANSAPVNSVAPSVSGTATVGNALSTTNGSWSDPDGDNRSFTYQWYRADDTNGTNAASITGATSATYTLTTSDAHKYLRVVVTANDGKGGTPTATSAYTAIANSAPVNSVAPSVTGTATVGNALSTTNGSWSDPDGDNRSYTYQWYRATDTAGAGETAITGATSATYTLVAGDLGKYVRVVVTANDGRGGTQTATSTRTVVAAGSGNGAPTNSVVPSVTGTAKVGNALSATNGSWTDPDGDSLSYTYQWYRADDTNGTNAASITGATSATYTLTTSDAHKYLRVVVTANDGNSHTPTATSTYTAIANSAPVNSVAPSVSGTATVGNALSTTNGSWSDPDGDNRSYTYQWYRADDTNGTNAASITGATSAT
ncbi:DUF4347 domain-containing protein, partial [Azospirillum isscasi]